MARSHRYHPPFLIVVPLIGSSILSTVAWAQKIVPETQASPSNAPTNRASSTNVSAAPVILPPWPELEVPTTRSIDELVEFVSRTKTLQPTTPERYREMQKAISEASKRIVELTRDRTSAIYRTAEFDYLSSSVLLLGNDGPEAQKKTYERFRDYLRAKSKPDENDLRMILLAGQNLEQIPDGKLAREAYSEFAKILNEKSKQEYQIWIETLSANARRVDLPGKEIRVKGKTITGEDFDIQSCKGKFTLIYFWASWESSVKPEYPYMRQLYLNYREKGFEIVAISVDQDRERLEAFLRENEVPWINLWDEENRSSPAVVQQYGISAIPTMILLDREGKVISMEARGLLLGSMLEKYLDHPINPPRVDNPKSSVK